MSNPEGKIVENAEHVAHADRVTNAVQTEMATVVGHADTISTVEVHGEPLRTNAVRRLRYIRDIASWFTILFALVVMVVVIIDKNANEDTLRQQVQAFQDDRTASDTLTSQKLECTRRYQDVIDATTEAQLILLGEFLVTITKIPPGPEREAAVIDKVTELDRTNTEARNAVNAKTDYNNAKNPLPCPLGETKPNG